LQEGFCPGVEGNVLIIMAVKSQDRLPNALFCVYMLSGQIKIMLDRVPAFY